jgi:hypothetical protein
MQLPLMASEIIPLRILVGKFWINPSPLWAAISETPNSMSEASAFLWASTMVANSIDSILRAGILHIISLANLSIRILIPSAFSRV